jgi:hypothetical protein
MRSIGNIRSVDEVFTLILKRKRVAKGGQQAQATSHTWIPNRLREPITERTAMASVGTAHTVRVG